jgi:hypothetical protein
MWFCGPSTRGDRCLHSIMANLSGFLFVISLIAHFSEVLGFLKMQMNTQTTMQLHGTKCAKFCNFSVK